MGSDGSILVVHVNPAVLGALEEILGAAGFTASVATSQSLAQLALEADDYDAIVAPWQPCGAGLYLWALEHKYHLRGRFVFLADETPEDFDSVVQGRCISLPVLELEAVVQAAAAAADRALKIRQLGGDELEWTDEETPTLLLVDDEPLQLSFMSRLFRNAGFSVSIADSGNSAIAMLGSLTPDALLIDWFMADGSGIEVYRWLRRNQSHLLERCVFMTGLIGDELDQIRAQVPECTVFPKGQDSKALVRSVVSTARLARAGA